ncbi:hypothetical protein SAMN05660350_00412 [Geodermatophilus obscurus]|uniref:Radical SAM domain protein n=1 Tax=Geodermatophilus obscurus TaxID=1861 RepID=A0A1M7S203_9ACTN|nr:hypothetical protein [Geodermatophilus obscurus]SHN52647.1 hypothetical protein SAMN05660350_00412 [Geodermatophilus obscurus]
MHLKTQTEALSLHEVARTARRFNVPVEDALLIAVNLYGIASPHNRHRARVTLRLHRAPSVPWTVIVPLNAHRSPFRLVEDQLLLGREPIGEVSRVDADEAVGGYFRDAGRAATLNPNARSRCVGCAFCPNTLEASADPRMAGEEDLDELLTAMKQQHPRGNLGELREVTVSTGCFEREDAAVAHLVRLRRALTAHGVGARIGFLTSVVTSGAALEQVAQRVGPFVLRLTVECFTRRDLLLKESKARLHVDEIPAALARARGAGLGASFTYIVGLDPLEALRAGVQTLVEQVSEFPNFQVYQAHNSIMEGLRVADVDPLEFCLAARRQIESIMAPTQLRPAAWECYRPLWYFSYAGEPLVKT